MDSSIGQMTIKTVAVIIPCYYNAESLHELVKRLAAVRSIIHSSYNGTIELKLALIDDGSIDNTPQLIRELQLQHADWINGIVLGQNIGSHAACIMGIRLIPAQAYVIISADLQDPPEIILQLVEEWRNGQTLVLAAREQRRDKTTNRLTAKWFHSWMRWLINRRLPASGFDCLLVDDSQTQPIKNGTLGRFHLFYELAAQFPHFSTISYIRQNRQHGHSRWTFKKKFTLALRATWRFSWGYAIVQQMKTLLRNHSHSTTPSTNRLRRIWWAE